MYGSRAYTAGLLSRALRDRPLLSAVAIAALAAAGGFLLLRSGREAPARFRPVPVPGDSFSLLPESERTLRRIVLGVRPHGFSGAKVARDASGARAVELRRRLFALDFTLLHGGTMSAAPAYAHFFVAIPDPARTEEASGEEEADFRAYLRERLGWTEDTIARRVSFFRVGRPLLYPQDMAEALGLDAQGRLVLGVGADTDPTYLEPVEALVREFPGDFAMRKLAGLHVGDVNLEGGDLALAWLPDGRIGILVGRHRALRYIGRKTGTEMPERALTGPEIDEVRRAYSSAFFGVEATIVGEAALRDRSRGSDALFHSDMVLATARNESEALAFVPTYETSPVDAATGELLDAAFVAGVQREYDLVAGQMGARGYRVVRMPFADHPVRAPVNVAKFVDRETGRPSVILGRYPEHHPPASGDPPSVKIAYAVIDLQTAVTAWEKRSDDARWSAVRSALARAWAELDAGARAPNALFDRQRALYEANGIAVVPLPLYPSGQGGVHCLLLR